MIHKTLIVALRRAGAAETAPYLEFSCSLVSALSAYHHLSPISQSELEFFWTGQSSSLELFCLAGCLYYKLSSHGLMEHNFEQNQQNIMTLFLYHCCALHKVYIHADFWSYKHKQSVICSYMSAYN